MRRVRRGNSPSGCSNFPHVWDGLGHFRQVTDFANIVSVRGKLTPGVTPIPADKRCALGCPYDPPIERVVLLLKAGEHVGEYPLCRYHLDRLESGEWDTVEVVERRAITEEG